MWKNLRRKIPIIALSLSFGILVSVFYNSFAFQRWGLSLNSARISQQETSSDIGLRDFPNPILERSLSLNQTSNTSITRKREDKNVSDVTSLYPIGPGNIGNFDKDWYIMTNTIASKNGLFGAASQDVPHWINSFQPGVDSSNASTLYVISPNGQYGITTAIRSSDNNAKSAQNIIGDNISCIADNPFVAHRTWCRYEHGVISENAAVGGHINDENSILNLGLEVATDPYNLNPPGQTSNVRLDSGVGNGEGKTVSAALSILSNSARYYSGIQFGEGAFDTSKTGGVSHAVQLPDNAALTWQHRSGLPNVDWRIYSSTFQDDNKLQLEGSGLVRIGPTNSGNIAIQGGSSPKVFSTAGELMLGSATGKLSAPIIDTRAIVSTGSVVDIEMSDLGIYGGIAEGVYLFPILQFSDSNNGATAFGRVSEMSVLSIPTIVDHGLGYVAGDVIALVGGAYRESAKIKVLAVNNQGAIINWERIIDPQLNDGYYVSAPTSPVSVKGGSGRGASFTNLGWRPTQLSFHGGSGYSLPPKVYLHGQTSPYAGSVSTKLSAKVDNSWTATAAAGAIVLDSSGTKLGTGTAPVIVAGDLRVEGAAVFSGSGSILAGGVDQKGATTLIHDYSDVTSVPPGGGVALAPYKNHYGVRKQEVWNSGMNPLLVYPPIGAAIGNRPPNTAVLLAPGSRAAFICFSPTSIQQAP